MSIVISHPKGDIQAKSTGCPRGFWGRGQNSHSGDYFRSAELLPGSGRNRRTTTCSEILPREPVQSPEWPRGGTHAGGQG